MEDYEEDYDSDPSDLGFDPYAGDYMDDDPVDPFDYDYED